MSPPLPLDEAELLPTLLAHLPVGVVAVDGTGRVRLLNAEAARQWGLAGPAPLPPTDALGLGTAEGVPLPPEHHPLARALRGEQVQGEPLRVLRVDGGQLAVQCDARPLTSPEGVRGAILVSRPVAEGTPLEGERQARLDAEAANRMKDEFLATVSHELRTPLNAVLGWASMLRQRKVDARLQEKALESIERNARVQAKLVEDLLDLGRIVSGKLRVTLHPTQPHPVVLAAVETVRPAAEAKGVGLQVELAPAEGLWVSADVERLQQVVWNLLANAVKFTPQGGRVQVRARAEEGSLVLEVEDTGIGIPTDFMPHLFERFRQADAGPVRTQLGLGLGLALVRHLVELHGGRVAAHSEGEGRGSTFRVLLPLLPAPAETPG